MLADAHIHLAELLDRDGDFPERMDSLWTCCAASHDEGEWEKTEALRARLPPFVSSFGIHPQWPVWKNADLLARLAAEGRLAAIGEAGFDFYGDRPERVRNPENERAQRAAFEYQLDLGLRHGLPLLLHLRKGMDLAFEYSPRLRRLPAAIFHCFPGTPSDAESLVARGVNAYFSFGASILNGNKRAAAACASVPEDRLLSETDAPWQPPKVAAERRADHCRAEDLRRVVEGMAILRGIESSAIEGRLSKNFKAAFNLRSLGIAQS
jgi:TatD DNase family protein